MIVGLQIRWSCLSIWFLSIN